MSRSAAALRRVAVVALAVYVAWLAFGYRYHFLDGVNLLIHEAGHVLFSPLGQTMSVAGGTILQLLFPLAFVVHFWRRGQRFGAAICGVWASESLMYTARYLGDAQAQELPLIGGHIHDWNYLLGQAGLLESASGLGTALHILASLAAIGCVWLAWREA
ncbi:MAG: hypothetical protein M8861_07055 [marine benthic group bacterium]|nr:hypothetical protein [Gemmatimonadota bacterium]